MSGVYKSLQPKDIRSTPYRAHKDIITAFDGSELSNDCKVYVAEHSLSSSYNSSIQGRTYIDIDNAYYNDFATTTDGYYKTAVHAQLDHLFYREYLDNNKATLGGGASINKQYRDIGSAARVVSFPTKTIGEGILPESLQITASGYTVVDDGYGNIVFSQGGTNGITNYDAADYDNIMTSYTFNKYYQYVSESSVSVINQQTTYGSYKLPAQYSNISFTSANTGGSIAAKFTSATSSNIKLICDINSRQTYNLLNRDYAIAFRIKLNATPSQTVVFITKAEPETDVAVDFDGNLFTSLQGKTQFPYKILVNSSRQLLFKKSDGLSTYTLGGSASALTLDTWYDVVIQRVGSTFTMYLNGSSVASSTDPFFANTPGTNYQSKEQDCGNRSPIYIGSAYDGTLGIDAELLYLHIFDRSLTSGEITNLHENYGWLGNYCGNVFYNLGLVVFTHPKITTAQLTQLGVKSTVTLKELEVYCTVGPGDFNITYNRTVQYWNPSHNAMEVDSRYTGSLFRPYVTTVGLYNDKNELLAVAKLSTPIQTSKSTDTTFVVKFDY